MKEKLLKKKYIYIYIFIHGLFHDLILKKSNSMIFLYKILKNNNNRDNIHIYYFLCITMVIIKILLL